MRKYFGTDGIRGEAKQRPYSRYSTQIRLCTGILS